MRKIIFNVTNPDSLLLFISNSYTHLFLEQRISWLLNITEEKKDILADLHSFFAIQ